MIENAEMQIFGHQARMVREEREGMDEAKQRDEGFIMPPLQQPIFHPEVVHLFTLTPFSHLPKHGLVCGYR